MSKRAVIEHIAPWLIWTTLLITLAIVAKHNGSVGVTTSNPRSLTQTSTIAATGDCRGETLQDRGEALGKK